MHYDLIVIGMGLSGLMAAKTAAEAGQKVLIVGKGMGSLCLLSNTIDVLGQFPKTMEMRDNLSEWIENHPEHPYSKVGLMKIEEALSSFLSLFPPPYSFRAIGNQNCFIPTGAGTLRATYLIPMTMIEGASLNRGNTLVVGFKGFKDFHALYVADQLRYRGITLTLPEALPQEIGAIALARLLGEESFREKIGTEIKRQLHGETRIGFPAVFGVNDPVRVKEDLEEIMGAKVFEIPILPPSIPGKRIFDRFKEWLIQRGVTFLLGYSVAKATLKGKKCEGIELFHPPVSTIYAAGRYILATGRFIGGGLKADRENVLESIFNLPVYQAHSREYWFEKHFLSNSPHPIHRTGILTDSSFQPVDERGNPILENLWSAGSILAHHHSIDEKSREGIEIATGYAAAKHALEK